MFNGYKRSKTNTSDNLDLSCAIITAARKTLPDDLYLKRNCDELEEICSQIVFLQARCRENSLTESLASLDHERDDINIGMEDKIDGEIRTKRYFPAKGEAAEALKIAFEAYPVNIKSGYAEESNQISVRIFALDNEESRAHFITLDMLPLFEHLKTVQEKFIKLSNGKDALESLELRGSVKDQVKRLQERISWVLPYLESQAEAGVSEYRTVAGEVSEAVTRVMSTASARRTRKLNEVIR